MIQFQFSYTRSRDPEDQIKGIPIAEVLCGACVTAKSEDQALVMIRATMLIPGKYTIAIKRVGADTDRIVEYLSPELLKEIRCRELKRTRS